MLQMEVPAGIDRRRLHGRLERRLERLIEAAHAEHRAVIEQWHRVSSIQQTLALLCRCAGLDPSEMELEGADKRLEELEAVGGELREFLRSMKGPSTRHGRWRGTWGVE